MTKSVGAIDQKNETTSSGTNSVRRRLSNEQIGAIAGDVWQLLCEEGDRSVTSIKKSIDAPSDVVAAALGWLAREGKLDFGMRGRAVTISLRDPE